MSDDKRKARRSKTAEFFTPPRLVDEMLDKLPPSVWESGKTFVDPACGNGNMLVQVLRRKLAQGHEPAIALKAIYGTDIMQDNIRECRLRLLKVVSQSAPITEEMIRTVFANVVATPRHQYPNGSLDYAFDFRTTEATQSVKEWHRDMTALLEMTDDHQPERRPSRDGAKPVAAAKGERTNADASPPVIAVEMTSNKKVGPVATTYASQATCYQQCEFLCAGCYAESGPCGLHTKRLNASPERDPLVIARLEAGLIDKIANPNGLRVHTVGDCTTAETARLVGEAMMRYQHRIGGRAWTYTHGWRETPHIAWGGANVLASCELLSQVREARARGYATCITVDKFKSKQAFFQDGIKIVPCPEQTVGKTCVECRMCLDAERLRQAGITIGFEAHGVKAKAIKKTVHNGLLRCSLLGWGRSA